MKELKTRDWRLNNMYISEEDYAKMKQMAENYDKIRAAQKKYRETHREIVSQRLKDWRERNPEKFNAIQKRYKEKKKGEQ